jgi:beta-lactamase class A
VRPPTFPRSSDTACWARRSAEVATATSCSARRSRFWASVSAPWRLRTRSTLSSVAITMYAVESRITWVDRLSQISSASSDANEASSGFALAPPTKSPESS